MTNPPVSLDQAIRAEIERVVQEIKGSDPNTFVAMAADELRDALHAVLDLHAPDEIGFCRECSDEFPAASPCPTVRAIAEKLGVEVDGVE